MVPSVDIPQHRRGFLLLLGQDQVDRERFTIHQPFRRQRHRAPPVADRGVRIRLSERVCGRRRRGDTVQNAHPVVTEGIQPRFPVVRLGVVRLERQHAVQGRVMHRILGRERRKRGERVPALDDERLRDVPKPAEPHRQDQRPDVVGLSAQVSG